MSSMLTFNNFDFSQMLSKGEKSRKQRHETKFIRQLVYNLLITLMLIGWVMLKLNLNYDGKTNISYYPD